MREPQAPAEHATVEHRRIARPVCLSTPPSLRRPVRTLVRAGILLTSLALAACQTDGAGMASGNGGLAFVSIDGPPKPTFDRLVTQLSSEAESRQMKVASRDDPGAYRVKGYLSMHVERGKASVAYAWDVYDANKDRVARVTGEESAGAIKGSGGWAACDDVVLAKIADRSMADLSAALGVGGARATPTPTATAAAPAESAPATSAATPAQEAPAQPADSEVPVAAAESPAPVLAYAAN